MALQSSPKVKILLVDDSAENLVALEAVLESLGQDLVKAKSGFEALRHLLDDDFAAIILDVKMPEMDGFETASLIRSRKRSQHTPILFLTGFRNEEHLFRGYDLGAVDFLFKPIVAEVLQSKVSVFVELSKNADLLRTQAEEIRTLNIDLERKVNERTAELIADIAERKRAEQALRESEQRLRVAIEAADLALWSIEVSSQAVSASPRLNQMFGFPEEASSDMEVLLNRIMPEDRDRAARQLLASLDGSAEFDCEFRVMPPGQNPRWIASRGRLLSEDHESPARLVAVSQDITGRRVAEEVVRHKQKLESMGLLAGGIAHDFNNLLTGILGHSSLVLEDDKLSTENRECLENVVLAAESAAQLTRQMLAYSGRGRFVVESVALSRRVRELLPLLQATLPKHVELDLDLVENLPHIEVDTAQLQQLVMNLVTNGAEAVGPHGGFVKLTTRLAEVGEAFLPDAIEGREIAPGTYVMLEVRDNGHGMDPATQSRIFDPFFTTKFTGRGLGLAAVLGIVRGHKGAIQLRSRPGEGTVFNVYFPPSEWLDHKQHEAASSAVQGNGLVLIVDDEETIRRTAKLSLERHGFTVLLARNGMEGVDLFRASAERVSVVLLDMAMPVMSGEQAFRKMVAIRPGIPVVASSGFDEQETLARFGEGLAGFLQKPYTAAQLARKLKEVTGASAIRTAGK
ncbi:MAG: Multi-sensor hybrid histidine kinase [Bryobacterales bacterium]|nr:Multi-sensor hybrid histidine kinase [Bryobacterales bacterium]